MNCDLVILLGLFSTMMILNLKSFKLLTHGLLNDTIDLLPTQNPNLNGGYYSITAMALG